MAFPQQVLDDIVLGQERYVKLNKEYLISLKKGCTDCNMPKDYACLQSILSNLINLQVIGDYNEYAQGLYYQMMVIIGGEIYVQVPPIVDAGPDKSALTSEPQTVVGTVIEGAYPIASLIWTQKSGTPATLSGQNTSTLLVSNFGTGDSVFEFKATDTQGNFDTDDMKITGLSVQATILFGYTPTNPFGNESVPALQFSKDVQLGAAQYVLDFTNAANLQYLIIKEPVGQPIKTVWINKAIFNEGVVPDSKMRAAVVIGSFRYYVSRVPFALDSEISSITLKTS